MFRAPEMQSWQPQPHETEAQKHGPEPGSTSQVAIGGEWPMENASPDTNSDEGVQNIVSYILRRIIA